MMNLNNFKLLKEDHEAYHVQHPGGKTLVVDKKALSPKKIEHIKNMTRQNFDEGGVAAVPEALRAPTPEEQSMPTEFNAMAPTPQQPQGSVGMPSDEYMRKNAAGKAPDAVTTDQDVLNQSRKQTEGVLNAEKQAYQKIGQAQAVEARKNAQALNKTMEEADQLPSQEEIRQAYEQKDKALFEQYKSKQIDPDRYYKNQDTASRVANSIGLLFSGFGSGVTGQPNMAMEMMKSAVDKDIEAQKNDQEKAANLWRMNRQQMGGEQAATLATQNQLYNGVKYKIWQNAMNAGTQEGAQKAQLSMAQIDQQIAGNNQQMALISTGLGVNPQGQRTGFSGDDPAVLVPQLIKDPGMQKQALKEIEDSKHIAKNKSYIMQMFDKADKENTIGNRTMHLGAEPAAVTNLENMMMPVLHDAEGRINETEINMMNNFIPKPGDGAKKIAEKREGLERFLTSKEAGTVSKAHGIDLTKFRQTSPTAEAQLNPQQMQYLQWARQHPEDPRAKAVMAKLGVK